MDQAAILSFTNFVLPLTSSPGPFSSVISAGLPPSGAPKNGTLPA